MSQPYYYNVKHIHLMCNYKHIRIYLNDRPLFIYSSPVPEYKLGPINYKVL